MLNKQAPDFALESSSGSIVRLSELAGSFSVLIFYPMNDTPVCNSQLEEASLNLQQFHDAGARVFGVNSAPAAKQKAYCSRKKLEIEILTDPGGAVAKQYKAHMVWLPFNLRTVAVVDPAGRICFYRRGKPSADEILSAIRNCGIPASPLSDKA